jgi:hypothetical protein
MTDFMEHYFLDNSVVAGLTLVIEVGVIEINCSGIAGYYTVAGSSNSGTGRAAARRPNLNRKISWVARVSWLKLDARTIGLVSGVPLIES